jgi:hypothetical protein
MKSRKILLFGASGMVGSRILDLKVEIKDAGKEVDYWLKYGNLSKNPLKRFVQRVANKL